MREVIPRRAWVAQLMAVRTSVTVKVRRLQGWIQLDVSNIRVWIRKEELGVFRPCFGTGWGGRGLIPNYRRICLAACQSGLLLGEAGLWCEVEHAERWWGKSLPKHPSGLNKTHSSCLVLRNGVCWWEGGAAELFWCLSEIKINTADSCVANMRNTLWEFRLCLWYQIDLGCMWLESAYMVVTQVVLSTSGKL